jgi:hypothetical protein
MFEATVTLSSETFGSTLDDLQVVSSRCEETMLGQRTLLEPQHVKPASQLTCVHGHCGLQYTATARSKRAAEHAAAMEALTALAAAGQLGRPLALEVPYSWSPVDAQMPERRSDCFPCRRAASPLAETCRCCCSSCTISLLPFRWRRCRRGRGPRLQRHRPRRLRRLTDRQSQRLLPRR